MASRYLRINSEVFERSDLNELARLSGESPEMALSRLIKLARYMLAQKRRKLPARKIDEAIGWTHPKVYYGALMETAGLAVWSQRSFEIKIHNLVDLKTARSKSGRVSVETAQRDPSGRFLPRSEKVQKQPLHQVYNAAGDPVSEKATARSLNARYKKERASVR